MQDQFEDLMVNAHTDGRSMREIGELVHRSQAAVRRVLTRASCTAARSVQHAMTKEPSCEVTPSRKLEHVCDRGVVGTNRRYPDAGARAAPQRRLQDARGRGDLQTLTDEQLQLTSGVVSIAPERGPMWALAWLRFGDSNIRCIVLVKRWTADAVGVEVEVGGDRLRCWVWQGAVERTEGSSAPS